MARREITIYTDDVTGEQSDDIHTVIVINGEGVSYAVDMGDTTYAAYEAAIAPYVAAGRRIGRLPKRNPEQALSSNVVPITRTVADKDQNKAVREWWSRNRAVLALPEVTDRGRIPQDVLDAYHKHAGRSIESVPIEAPAVKPAQTKRAAGTVGAEMRVPAATFKTAQEQPEVTPAAKSAAKAAPVKGRTTTARVASKPPTAAKRAGRRTAAS